MGSFCNGVGVIIIVWGRERERREKREERERGTQCLMEMGGLRIGLLC